MEGRRKIASSVNWFGGVDDVARISGGGIVLFVIVWTCVGANGAARAGEQRAGEYPPGSRACATAVADFRIADASITADAVVAGANGQNDAADHPGFRRQTREAGRG
jgi:hypothetical protein